MHSRDILALAATISGASAAAIQGFNYGAETDFATAFVTQKALAGTNGAFTSARLYTTVDPAGGPTSAIPAAINSGTTLLLGIWASAGQANIDTEIAALKQAINTYGSSFAKLVTGISVGSEDLYRDSVTGIINMSGVGAAPSDIVSYISQVRAAIAGTVLASAPVGHVDTWTAYVNGSNSAVITACDFLGVDAYPYFQNTQANGIANGQSLFFSAYDQTVAVAQGKPVWVTETGWPVSGPTSGQAVPSTANAQTYWDQVGCKLFGTTNTYWYTLNDNGAAPSFGVTTGSTTPLYNLTCPAAGASSSSSSAVASSSTSAVAATSAASTAGTSSTMASASSSAAASVSAATSSQSAIATQIGGGSPQDTKSAAGDSSVAVSKTASPSAYSSAVASASSAASAASTMSLSTTTTGGVVHSSTSGSAAATGSSAATGSAASSAKSSASASRASTASGAAAGTTTSAPATYTGAAAPQAVGSIGGIVGAIFAAVALF